MTLVVSVLQITRLILSGFLFFLLVSCSFQRGEEFFFHGKTMGTSYSVKIFFYVPFFSEKILDSKKEEIQQKIEDLLKSINQEMSTYISDSAISTFNKYPAKEWFTISSNFKEVLESSLHMERETKGAFDVTVGPLVNIWGFGPEEKELYSPSEEEIKKTKAIVGMKFLEIKKNKDYQIRKLKEGVYLDFSAIAKGYGVDMVAGLIESLGYENYLVEIGGDLRTNGLRKGKPWSIAIEEAVMSRGKVQSILKMKDMSLASSGDYRNYYEIEGKRFSHMIDPRSARPISHSLAAVSVLHKDCTLADAWATALMVLGEKEGHALAEAKKLRAIFFIREGDAFRIRESSGFKNYKKLNP